MKKIDFDIVRMKLEAAAYILARESPAWRTEHIEYWIDIFRALIEKNIQENRECYAKRRD